MELVIQSFESDQNLVGSHLLWPSTVKWIVLMLINFVTNHEIPDILIYHQLCKLVSKASYDSSV